jgi:glycerol-3-phosphate acyltransferase PlsX
MIWVAVDAMGGDDAPRPVVDGALAAARHFDLGVALVGPSDVLDTELQRFTDLDSSRVRVVDAREVVAMDESPSAALRRKPGATIKVAAELVARGKLRRCSARNTGATVMAEPGAFGMLPGVDRRRSRPFRPHAARGAATSTPAWSAGRSICCSSR